MFSTTRQNYQKYKINQLFGDVKPNKSRAPENEIFFTIEHKLMCKTQFWSLVYKTEFWISWCIFICFYWFLPTFFQATVEWLDEKSGEKRLWFAFLIFRVFFICFSQHNNKTTMSLIIDRLNLKCTRLIIFLLKLLSVCVVRFICVQRTQELISGLCSCSRNSYMDLKFKASKYRL